MVENLDPNVCVENSQEGMPIEFNCSMPTTTCVRGRWYLDGACTNVDHDFNIVCGSCLQDVTGNLLYFKFECGNTNNNGIVRLHYNCTDVTCGHCNAELQVPMVGLCTLNPVRSASMMVNDLNECQQVKMTVAVQCPATPAEADLYVTLAQGQCGNFDGNSDAYMQVSCPGYQQPPPVNWLTPVTGTPPQVVTTTTTPPPATSTAAPTTPTPSGATAPPVTAPSLRVTTCTDTAYCRANTCGAPSTVATAACVANAAGDGAVQYQCGAALGATCINAQRYTDNTCAQMRYPETVVCNRCVPDVIEGGFMYFGCDAATSAVTIAHGCNAGCSSCGPPLTLVVGSCGGSWVLSSEPFACTAVSRTAYSTADCGAGTEQGPMPTVAFAQGECHQGTVFQCSDYVAPPAATAAPPGPTAAATAVSSYSSTRCNDAHCSFGCNSSQYFSAGCSSLVIKPGEIVPAATPTGTTSFSAQYSCSQVTAPAAVLSWYNDSGCTFPVGERAYVVGACQRSPFSGNYMGVTAAGLVIDDCTATCGSCNVQIQLAPYQCTAYAGHYFSLQRFTPPTPIARKRVYAGLTCGGEPLADESVSSGTCNDRALVFCTPTPSPTPPGQTNGGTTAPINFVATFTARPDAAVLGAALSAYFNEAITVVWTSGPTSCGAAPPCFTAEFRLAASTTARASFFRMEDAPELKPLLLSNFNITALAQLPAPPNPAPAPTSKRDEDHTTVIIVGVVCAVLAILLILFAALFVRARSGGARGKSGAADDYVSADYVSMQERADRA